MSRSARATASRTRRSSFPQLSSSSSSSACGLQDSKPSRPRGTHARSAAAAAPPHTHIVHRSCCCSSQNLPWFHRRVLVPSARSFMPFGHLQLSRCRASSHQPTCVLIVERVVAIPTELSLARVGLRCICRACRVFVVVWSVVDVDVTRVMQGKGRAAPPCMSLLSSATFAVDSCLYVVPNDVGSSPLSCRVLRGWLALPMCFPSILSLF